MNNKMSEIKNTLEGVTSRLDETQDRISELKNKYIKKLPERARKGKKTQKERRGVKRNAEQHET